MKLAVGSKVIQNEEHPGETGEIMRFFENGGASIQWDLPASKVMPYGGSNIEFWPASDLRSLTVIA